MSRPDGSRPRVVVAGMGDTGTLTAIHLARHADVVGISSQPGLVSGQELGQRLARPDDWAREYWLPFDRFRRLRGVRTVHGVLTGLDPGARTVHVDLADGSSCTERYDVLVIATGVGNGFWRTAGLRTPAAVAADLRAAHERLARASSVAVVGGGAAAVNAAVNLGSTWPDTRVGLFFPGERPLLQHHPRIWSRVRRRLDALGVGWHPGHRAEVPADADRITGGPVRWTTGQQPSYADAVIWALGRVRPHTGWLPPDLLDDRGFVRVAPDLRVPGHPGMFAVGDVAATDSLRSSARNRADRLVARNIRAHLAGRPLDSYRPPRRRWGSVMGFQPDGLTVFAPNGRAFRFPAWTVGTVLQPGIVRWGIYGGVRVRPGHPALAAGQTPGAPSSGPGSP